MSLSARLITAAQRALGFHVDAAPAPVVAPAAEPPLVSLMDCGAGGCSPFYGAGSIYGGGFDRDTIDELCTADLMRRVVNLIVEDALSRRPSLSGKTGELSSCIDWIESRGFFVEAARALTYMRRYGGGALICIVDDGRPADQEIDLLNCRDVIGFFALPKYYCIPAGTGSSRVASAWYGQRIGRPEFYYVSPGLSMSDASGGRPESYSDILKIIARSGSKFHRSRVIAWPHVDELDMRQARRQAEWQGWGPGIVEACASSFMARRSGALRLAAIMNSVVVNTVTMEDLEHRQSTEDAGAAVRARLEFIKACRDFMSDSVPLIATDTRNKFSSLTHTVSGIDKLIEAQRQFFLDSVPEYPAVVLFGDSVGGISGGDRSGEWRTYATRVGSFCASKVWQAGSFGGGMRQAVLMAMACKTGPTSGQMDLTVRAEWPSILETTDGDKARHRLLNAQARAQDRLTLGLSPAMILRFDPTFKTDYPGLDVDDGPLPVLDPPVAGEVAQGVTVTEPAAGEMPATTTPGAVNKELAGEPDEQGDAAASMPPPAPAKIPADIATEGEIAAALRMTRPALRRLLTARGVRPYLEGLPGQRGGARYSLGEAIAAVRQQAAAAPEGGEGGGE